ncbi:MAG TPA: redoxin domain-containing protein [Gaiellaceae bacterium]|nr:redoxin domain-containing protein [Gaiellaceae bacterium]
MLKDLQPGDTFPDFELPDENGVGHRLSDLQGKNPLVLQLGRGEHCPRERQHHRELLKFHEWCGVLESELVTIVPNDLHDTLKLKMTTGGHWTFLADVDLEVRETLGIEEYVDDHHTASVPHTVVLGPGLEIFKVYCGFWFFGRPSVYDLWNDMRELRMQTEYNFDPLAPGVREEWTARKAARTPVAMTPPNGARPSPAKRRRSPARAKARA